MPSIGPMELVIVLLVLLIVVGPKKLPTVGRSLGSGMREFKDSLTVKDAGAEAARPPERDPAPATVGPGQPGRNSSGSQIKELW